MPRIVQFNRLGGPEVLAIEDVPSSEPSTGEVTLRVQAIGLNRAESMFMHGYYLEPRPRSDQLSTRGGCTRAYRRYRRSHQIGMVCSALRSSSRFTRWPSILHTSRRSKPHPS